MFFCRMEREGMELEVKNKMFLWLIFSCIIASSAWPQEFPIGIWFAGNQKAINSVSALNFTWIHAYAGWNRRDTPNYKHIVQNNRRLKVIAVLEQNINYPSFAQRLEYQAWRTQNQEHVYN